MTEQGTQSVPVSIVGLPGSGKTTFLAALWHLVQSDEVDTTLKFGALSGDDFAYLNLITEQWRRAIEQKRTALAGIKSVSMTLADSSGRRVRLTFPDVPGEEYRRMWEERTIDEGLAKTLSSGNIMLLVNGDRIRKPAWVTEQIALMEAIGEEPEVVDPEVWHPKHAPTQVQLVDLLQHLRRSPLDCGPRRLVVLISAWDKAEGERLMPLAFLRAKLPLLGQYLESSKDCWEWRVYGVSAQGGDYDEEKRDAAARADAARLRDLDFPSQRIRLVSDEAESHDLTIPLEWLMT